MSDPNTHRAQQGHEQRAHPAGHPCPGPLLPAAVAGHDRAVGAPVVASANPALALLEKVSASSRSSREVVDLVVAVRTVPNPVVAAHVAPRGRAVLCHSPVAQRVPSPCSSPQPPSLSVSFTRDPQPPT
jgi:hypothetical protein